MLLIFRLIAILEGISYILILGFTMPLKYWAGIATPNKLMGIAHGVLFILFVVLSAIYCWRKKWGIRRFIVFFAAYNFTVISYGMQFLMQIYEIEKTES